MKTSASLTDLVVAFFLLSLVFALVERVLGRRRGHPWLRRGWLADVIYWFFSPIVTATITQFLLIGPVVVLIWCGAAKADDFRLGHYHGYGPMARQPVWLQVIEIYTMFDFIGYWAHRFFHGRRWWPFHAVHHSSKDLDWLSSVRIHPVNDLGSKLLQVTPFLWLGFDPFVTVSTAPFFTFYAIFVHAAVDWDLGPLRGILASPVFHRWHHSKDEAAWDKNFAGLFAFWDRMFGTYYMPSDRLPDNFGIPEEFPEGFIGQVWKPFAHYIPSSPVLRNDGERKTVQF